MAHEQNPYELLELTTEATEADIRRAYRQRSLKIHPDKNPDNPNAPRLFHELRQSYELLLDPLRRMALDAKIRLVSAKKERYSAYDAKRKAMVADLEEREAAFKKTRADKDREERSKWTDNERIKEEGRKLREARQRRMEEAEEATKLRPSSRQATPSEDEPPELGSLDTTVRLKYALSKYPTLTTPIALAAVLSTFGAVDAEASVVSLKPPKKAPHKPPKNATALIVFTTIGAAFAAVDASGRRERGLEGIEVCWAGGGEPPLIGWLKKKGMLQNSHAQDSPSPGTPLSTSAAPTVPPQVGTSSSFPDTYPLTAGPAPSPINGVDFESLTLMRMRQAERERLEREILEQEQES